MVLILCLEATAWGWHARASDANTGQADLEQALQAYREAEDKLRKEMLNEFSEEHVAQRFVFEAPLEKLAHFGPRFLEIANNHPQSEIAWKALRQIAYVRGFSDDDKLLAMNLLIRDHSARSEFREDIFYHLYRPGVDANKFCRLVLDAEGLDADVVDISKFTLATDLSGVIKNEEQVSSITRDEAVSLLRAVQSDHPELPHPNKRDKRTLGEAAAELEFYIQNLMIGNEAPALVGETVDREEIRLRDYRGKVTLLVFCGEWCAPCRAMVPHEKAFVADYQDRGFAILGINSDPKETLARAIEREKYPWKWIWDNGTARGPIARSWCVDNWPTFVLIDQQGVIRKKKFSGDESLAVAASIRREIELLLTEPSAPQIRRADDR